jgi:CBS domain-containing protein
MKIKDIMTVGPASCTPETPLREVAQLMIDNDCGEIPVVNDSAGCIPVGVITDRDIVCRTLGKGFNPLEMTAADCMSSPVLSLKEDDPLDLCYRVMEENQIRRVPIVDASGKCTGIVSLADVAQKVSMADSGEVLQGVSASSMSASNVG